ncbi:hypothetical protein GALMADRAFT_80366, partial [Galerina marginata CBS 339.88]
MLAVSWDLNDPPATITRNRRHVTIQTFAEPATSPPLGFMTIAIENIPWKIRVYASYKTYITLEDVIQTIYLSLRTNIAKSELDSLSQK